MIKTKNVRNMKIEFKNTSRQIYGYSILGIQSIRENKVSLIIKQSFSIVSSTSIINFHKNARLMHICFTSLGFFDLRKQGARRLIQTWQIYLESINQEYVLQKNRCMALHRTQLISAREKSVVFRIYVEIRGGSWCLVFLESAPKNFFLQNENFLTPPKKIFLKEIFLIFSYWVFLGFYNLIDTKTLLIGYLFAYKNQIQKENNN